MKKWAWLPVIDQQAGGSGWTWLGYLFSDFEVVHVGQKESLDSTEPFALFKLLDFVQRLFYDMQQNDPQGRTKTQRLKVSKRGLLQKGGWLKINKLGINAEGSRADRRRRKQVFNGDWWIWLSWTRWTSDKNLMRGRCNYLYLYHLYMRDWMMSCCNLPWNTTVQ